MSLPGRVKVSIVEHEKILVLIFDTLNGVRNSLGEVPDVAVTQLLSLVDAVFINGRHDDFARVDDTPFRLCLSAVTNGAIH